MNKNKNNRRKDGLRAKVVPGIVETVKVPRQILSMELEPPLSAH